MYLSKIETKQKEVTLAQTISIYKSMLGKWGHIYFAEHCLEDYNPRRDLTLGFPRRFLMLVTLLPSGLETLAAPSLFFTLISGLLLTWYSHEFSVNYQNQRKHSDTLYHSFFPLN